jgi:phospholipid/cholesterol/gamma-HCH transport system substrate-binding protein
MNESNNKRFVIVGVFVFVGLLFLGAGIFIVGDLKKTFEKKIDVITLFDDVAGLQRGNNIWLSGVKVGTVKEMAFYGNSKVRVTMQIEERAEQFIPADSKVKISSDGLIGNKILVIYGGSENARKVHEGDTLVVEKTLTTEDMLTTLQKNNENVLAITSDLMNISKGLVNGEGTLGKLLTDNSAYENINQVTRSLQRTMVEAQQMINSLTVFTANLNKEGTLANELTTDTIVFNSFKNTILQLQTIADTTTLLISNLSNQMNNPASSYGVIMTDEKTGNHLKNTIKNLESSSEKLNEDLEALQHSSLLKKYFRKKTKAEGKGN